MSSCGDTNDFIIPKGLDFDFTVQILEEDSFLPQNLDGFLNGTLKIITTSTGANAGLNDIALTKITEDVIAPVVLVEEETELTIAVGAQVIYNITINGTTYTVDMTANGSDPTTAAVATAFSVAMGVLPQNVTLTYVALSSVLTIKNSLGQANTIVYTTNIAQTNYIVGVEAVAGYTSTFYNDNGYLSGTITAAQTALLNVSRGDEVDGYYLKSLYQGILQVNFSDNTLDKTAIVCSIYVVHTGV